VGRAARTDDEWTGALVELLADPAGARARGANGRRLVEQRYSLTEVAARWRATAESWLRA
jgi:glycosyltransferase involved in cell wall biosynthesis